MSLTLTLILFLTALAGFAWSAWQTRKEPDPVKGPRLIPWTLLAITFGFLILIFAAHLLSFVGIETGGRTGI